MEINKELVLGLFLGIAVISLFNIILIALNNNPYTANGYIFLVSFIITIFFLAVELHLLRPRFRRR